VTGDPGQHHSHCSSPASYFSVHYYSIKYGTFAMRVVLIFVESDSAFASVLCIRKTSLTIAGLNIKINNILKEKNIMVQQITEL
jgi:hypothetical protein